MIKVLPEARRRPYEHTAVSGKDSSRRYERQRARIYCVDGLSAVPCQMEIDAIFSDEQRLRAQANI